MMSPKRICGRLQAGDKSKNGLLTDKEDVKLTGTMTERPHHMGDIGLGRYNVYLIKD